MPPRGHQKMQMVGHWTDRKQRQKVQSCINLDAAPVWPLCTVTMLNWNPGCIFLWKFSPGDFTEWSGNEQKPFSWLLRPPNWAREVRVHYLSKGMGPLSTSISWGVWKALPPHFARNMKKSLNFPPFFLFSGWKFRSQVKWGRVRGVELGFRKVWS